MRMSGPPPSLQKVDCTADWMRGLVDGSKEWAAAYTKLIWMLERTSVALSGSIEELVPPSVKKHDYNTNTDLKSAIS